MTKTMSEGALTRSKRREESGVGVHDKLKGEHEDEHGKVEVSVCLHV